MLCFLIDELKAFYIAKNMVMSFLYGIILPFIFALKTNLKRFNGDWKFFLMMVCVRLGKGRYLTIRLFCCTIIK